MSESNNCSSNGILNDKTLAMVINQVNLGIYLTDLERRIIFWNEEAERITGFKAGQVLGKACHENILMHTDRNGNPLCTTNLCPLFRAMQTGRDSDEPVLIYAHRADSELIPVSVSVAPLKDEQGQIVGGIETFRDESSRIQDQTLAKAVQRHFLPDGMPELPGVHLSAEYHPHDMIGGDYYDVRELDDGRLFLAVMDVSGHGVASALFTTFLNGLVSRFSHMTGTPGAFITAINAKLADVVGSSRFVTAFACVYDVRKQTLTWSSGGHPSPVRLSQHGEQLTGFQADGPPLGIAKNMIYPENETRLESGELLVFYTDGASELRNESGEMFGLNGMAALSAQVMRIGRENLAGRLYTRLLEESSDIDQPDDITLVALSVD